MTKEERKNKLIEIRDYSLTMMHDIATETDPIKGLETPEQVNITVRTLKELYNFADTKLFTMEREEEEDSCFDEEE